MKTTLLPLVGFCAVLSACEKCEGVSNAHEASLQFALRDASGTNSIFSPPTAYAQDSVKVRDEQGNPVSVGFTPETRTVLGFSLLEIGKSPRLGQLTTRQFILYFKRNDQDTIRAEYELFENDCNRPDFKSLKIFYNDRKLHEGNNSFIPELVVRKP